jgi:hypothetical protein
MVSSMWLPRNLVFYSRFREVFLLPMEWRRHTDPQDWSIHFAFCFDGLVPFQHLKDWVLHCEPSYRYSIHFQDVFTTTRKDIDFAIGSHHASQILVIAISPMTSGLNDVNITNFGQYGIGIAGMDT